MKLQIPILIFGFLVFVLPIIGLPAMLEKFAISIIGLLIMVAIYAPFILTNYTKEQQKKGQNSKTNISNNYDGQENK
jgi:ABC-type transport system involved in cytochrome bd biosynthesis fused ATPase/permease subunit